MRKPGLIAVLAMILLGVVFFVSGPTASAVTAATVTSPYLYNFNSTGTVLETGSGPLSSSPYWWLSSGAYFKIYSGLGRTNEGDLPDLDPWRVLYNKNNPVDTDNGYHPQNIFRLVTQSKWQNARQETYFQIKKDNLSASQNRNQTNGLFFFNRYQDQNNLYYTGIRVDGTAIVKKKQNGRYYTLGQAKGVYSGTYHHDTNPNVLPKNKWIGLRSEVTNNPNGSVRIVMYIDKGWSGVWQKVVDVTDGWKNGTPITNAGFGGIRTDFMDVAFENFRFTTISP